MTAVSPSSLSSNQPARPSFTLHSHDLGGQLAAAHYATGGGYTGANQSPQLYWEHAPADTQAFAVTMYDLDAPTGSGFWHWVVFNLPPTVHELPAGAGSPHQHLLPAGTVQSLTDMGAPGYAGAAPNGGPAHHYLLTVHALCQPLDLPASATPALVGFTLHFATLAKASLLAYGQKQ